MNGYSKMKESTTAPTILQRSRSTAAGFPDHNPSLSPPTKPWKSLALHDPEASTEGGGERFGLVLSRTCSSVSHRFRSSAEKGLGGGGGAANNLPGAVRRAFSMRRGSALTDGYWRIHDTCDDDEEVEGGGLRQSKQGSGGSSSVGRKKGKILRACKRLFGIKSSKTSSASHV